MPFDALATMETSSVCYA